MPKASSNKLSLLGLGIGITPEDLIDELSPAALSAALRAPVKNRAHARKALASLDRRAREQFSSLAERLLAGARIDKEELEEIAKTHNVVVAKSTPSDLIVFNLIQSIGNGKADELIEKALKPGQIDYSGTFSSFCTPPLDWGGFQSAHFAAQLELLLQTRLSEGKDERRVKVRAEWLKNELLVQVHFERPDVDGREITSRKRLVLTTFRRGAGSTFFRFSKRGAEALLTLRSPASSLAQFIRESVGAVLWRNASAISTMPAKVYDLSVFKNPKFVMPLAPDSGFDVFAARLHQIEVIAATGNLLQLTARGTEGNALSDFRQLAEEAHVFTSGSDVRMVDMKFTYQTQGGRRRVARAKLRPASIHLDEEHWPIVDAHLRAWKVVRD